MKTISVLVLTLCLLTNSINAQKEFASLNSLNPDASIDQRVLNAFSITFPAATDANWFEDAGRYTVNFTVQESVSTAVYNKSGELLTVRSYYTKENLALPLLIRIQKKYPGKDISGITEITNGDEVVYEIVLKDRYFWYKVIADNSNTMDLIQKFRRGE